MIRGYATFAYDVSILQMYNISKQFQNKISYLQPYKKVKNFLSFLFHNR